MDRAYPSLDPCVLLGANSIHAAYLLACAARSWNSLPTETRGSDTVGYKYERQLETYLLFDRTFCSSPF